jgi:hypothetical protein
MCVHRDFDEKTAKGNWTEMFELLLRNLFAVSGNSRSGDSVIEAIMRKMFDGLRGCRSTI